MSDEATGAPQAASEASAGHLGRGLVELTAGSWYELGFADLEASIAETRRRIARGRERVDDRRDVEELELALAELRALYRADLRVALELGDEATPHDVALVQAEELLADDLTLRTIPLETRDALRRDREADYFVLLYGFNFADPGGGHSATT